MSSSSSTSSVITFEAMGLDPIIQQALVAQGLNPTFLSTLNIQEYNAFIRGKSVIPEHIANGLGLTSGELPDSAAQVLRNFILKKRENVLPPDPSLKPSTTFETFCAAHFQKPKSLTMPELFKCANIDFFTLLKFESAEEFVEAEIIMTLFNRADAIAVWRSIEIERSFEPGAPRLESQPIDIPESKETKTPAGEMLHFFNRYNLFPIYASPLATLLDSSGITLDNLLRADFKNLKVLLSDVASSLGEDNLVRLYFAIRAESRRLTAVLKRTPTGGPSINLDDFANKRLPKRWFEELIPALDSLGITLETCLQLASLDLKELAAIPLDSSLKSILLYDALLDELKVREALAALKKKTDGESKEIKKETPVRPDFSHDNEKQKLIDFFTYYKKPSLMLYIDTFDFNKITLDILLNIDDFKNIPLALKNTFTAGILADLWIAIRHEQAHRCSVEALDLFYREEINVATIAPITKLLGEYMGFFGSIAAKDLKAARERMFIKAPGGPAVKKTVEVRMAVTSIDGFFERYPTAVELSFYRDFLKEHLHSVEKLLEFPTNKQNIIYTMFKQTVSPGQLIALEDAINQEKKIVAEQKLRERRETARATPPGGPATR